MHQVAAPGGADRMPDERLGNLALKGPRVEPPFDAIAAASHRAGRLDGLCLIDAQGRLLAANDAYRNTYNDSLSAARLAEEVQRRLAGMPPSDLEDDTAAILQMDRLDGPSGQMMLITIRPRHAAILAPHVDALTQLPDRRVVAERAEIWRSTSSGGIPRFAVLFLDLDGFKGVNDRHGHAVGDALLKQLAARWLQCVRDADLVARYGGDEFVALIKDAATPDEVEPIIRRLRDATRRPVIVGNLALSIDAAIGWSTPTDAAWTIDALLAAADRDMYARKGHVLG
jgi:diguanylate cyclase (GGDEF)-like protein